MTGRKVEKKELLSIRTKTRTFDTESSYLKKYQKIVVGEQSFLSLLRYELTITTISAIPGALGILLRKYFYKYLFKPKLVNVIFGKNVDVFNPNRIQIGRNCLIGDNCLLDVKPGGGISIGNNVIIGRGSLLRTGQGSIEVGDNVTIAAYSHISAIGTNVKLGNNVAMAAYGYIIGTGGYNFESETGPMIETPKIGQGVVIEDNVWLGGGVTIIDGSTVGTGSIIGAGSIVTKDIPEYSIAVGIPAKVIRKHKKNK